MARSAAGMSGGGRQVFPCWAPLPLSRVPSDRGACDSVSVKGRGGAPGARGERGNKAGRAGRPEKNGRRRRGPALWSFPHPARPGRPPSEFRFKSHIEGMVVFSRGARAREMRTPPLFFLLPSKTAPKKKTKRSPHLAVVSHLRPLAPPRAPRGLRPPHALLQSPPPPPPIMASDPPSGPPGLMRRFAPSLSSLRGDGPPPPKPVPPRSEWVWGGR